jgi:hypothetical protein
MATDEQPESGNVGLRHVRGPVLAFPDDDCAYLKGTLRQMLDFFQSSPDGKILSGRNMEMNLRQTNCTPLRPELISASLLLRNTASDENLGVGAPFGAAEENDHLYRLLRDGMRPYGANTTLTHHPDKELEPSNFRRASNYDLGAGAYFRKNLIADPVFLAMAARALIGPALRARRSAILRERVATEYHARTLFVRYKGFLTWPSTGRLGRQVAKGERASESSRAPGWSNLLGVEASGDGKTLAGRQATVRKNTR